MADEFEPGRFATSQLMWHILKKGWQAGAVVGVCTVAPVAAARMYRSGNKVDSERLLVLLAYSAATGLGLTGALGGMRCASIDKEGVDDRVYRLYYNEGQNRVDKFAAAGGLLGGGLAAGTIGRNPYAIVGGAAAGSVLGILGHCGTYWKKGE